MASFPINNPNFINGSPRGTNGAWSSSSHQFNPAFQPNIYGQQVQYQGQFNPYAQTQHYQVGQVGQQNYVQQHVQSTYQTEYVPQMQTYMQTEMIPMQMMQTEIVPQMQTMVQTEMVPMQVQEVQTVMVQEPVVEMVPVPVQINQVHIISCHIHAIIESATGGDGSGPSIQPTAAASSTPTPSPST